MGIAKFAASGLIGTLLTNPFTWVAFTIGMLVGAMYDWIQSVGGVEIAWLTAKNTALTALDNMGLGIMSFGFATANTFGQIKTNVLLKIQEMANGAIDIINDLIYKVNGLPGIAFDTIDHLTFGTTAQIEFEASKSSRLNALEGAKISAQMDAFARQTEIDIAKQNAADRAAGVNQGFDFSDFGTPSNPLSVDGTGKDKAIKVDMSKEDLKYLRDVAEREYINKFSTATLAPNVIFNISDIKETADVNKLKGTLERMMREEIAVAAEGVYS